MALADERLHSDLLRARQENGQSQQDVATLMGVTQPSVAAFERYDNDPKQSTVRRYANAVGVVVWHAVRRLETSHTRTEWSVYRPARAEFSVGVAPTSLHNPEGFDVASERSRFVAAA